MANVDIQTLRAAKKFAKMDADKQMVGQNGSGSSFGSGGLWNRAEWDAFHAQYGRYPFGMQPDGSVIRPSSYAGCPDWAYELMRERKPPVQVAPDSW